MLTIEQSVLVVIDVQGKLATMMQDENYVRHIQGMMTAAQVLNIPIIMTEQSPDKIGTIIDKIRKMAPEAQPIVKKSFSCFGQWEFVDALKLLHRKQIIITGIEAHVCVYQTVSDLLKAKYEIYIVTDAVSARSAVNKEIALRRSEREGAVLITLEMAVTELIRTAEHPKFREIMSLLKNK